MSGVTPNDRVNQDVIVLTAASISLAVFWFTVGFLLGAWIF